MRRNAHSHNYDEILVCVDGTHLYGVGDMAAALHPGSVVFLPRRQSHDSWYGNLHAACVDFWIHLLPHGEATFNFVVHRPGAPLKSYPVRLPGGDPEKAIDRLSAMILENRPIGKGTEGGYFLLYSLASLFGALSREGRQVTPADESAVILGIKRYVVKNLTEDLTLKGLAKAAGYSPFHFHRLFALSEGITPRQFVERKRLEHACDLLIAGQSITSAAYDSGFSSSSQFARIFRKCLNVSPRDWVKLRERRSA